ncbi:MAG: hypothetical protein O3B13_06325 [Planctomycetota bacterium]|nr:hypothetical protein [Planctomycetota bacterium]MDA1162697.1 hypothetical protein [Planctomycetota bacterium]
MTLATRRKATHQVDNSAARFHHRVHSFESRSTFVWLSRDSQTRRLRLELVFATADQFVVAFTAFEVVLVSVIGDRADTQKRGRQIVTAPGGNRGGKIIGVVLIRGRTGDQQIVIVIPVQLVFADSANQKVQSFAAIKFVIAGST